VLLGPWGLSGGSDQFGGCCGDSRSPLALEALTAEDRTSLCGLEGYGGLDTALRAMGASLGTGKACCSRTRTRSHACTGPFRLARFASLGVVFELLIEKKELFAGGEYEFSTAICTS
jgi:hypothetical protein